MNTLPLTRIVLYKHGVGHFEREGSIEDDATLSLTFKQAEVSDVLKSLTVLDEGGGHVASVSYDSTKPLEQLLAEVALSIPDQGSLVGLLPQIKGARVAVHTGVDEPVEGSLLGIDTTERQTGDGVVHVVLVSLLTDSGEVRSFDLHHLAGLKILDAALRRDLDYYLRTQLSAKKKDARTFTFFAQGQGTRTVRLSYTLEAPDSPRSAVSSMPTQVRERKLGDLFEYEIEHPVTIRRNQSALVPIVLRPFEGRPVLLYNKAARAENPMRAVEFKNTTALTLEGGPVTVLEGGSYVGEAMLETLKPDEERLVPYAVELSVRVLDNVDSGEGTVTRVVIRNRLMTTFRVQVQQTTYNLHN